MAACQSCGVGLPGRRWRCDACARARRAAAARQRRAADPAAAVERLRRWRAANPEKVREQTLRSEARRRIARAAARATEDSAAAEASSPSAAPGVQQDSAAALCDSEA